MKYFCAEIVEAAQNHARELYPEEACGVVVRGAYHRITNKAADPATHRQDDRECPCRLCSFELDPVELVTVLAGDEPEGYIHSHPDGPFFPSESDMVGQLQSGVPWGIVTTDGDRVGPIVEFGDGVPIAPILGRRFMHGVHDCYSLIRDTFRLGREELAKQGIDWPFDPILLGEMPRDDAWWANGKRLYEDNFAMYGFRRISMSEARPGDAFLCSIISDVPNHAGLLLSNNLVMHHLPGETRISRREPAGGWARLADMWLRYHPELVGFPE